MSHYYFHLVNVVFVGPNPEWDTNYAGAHVNCIVQAADKVSAVEALITAFKEDGFHYEAVEEVMEISEALEKFGKEHINPQGEDLTSLEGVNYSDFHLYPHPS